MKHTGTLKVTMPSEREIAMTRVLDAPRRKVFEALTTPALIQRWLLGPPGWTMPVCRLDLRVGGTYRYEWRREEDRSEMGMGGVVREVVPGERFVVTEKFDVPWYPGEAQVTNSLAEEKGQTTLTLTLRYESREARDVVLKSPMKQGVVASYDRLEELVSAPEVRGAAQRSRPT